jgi:hypothetical protein
VPLPSAFDIGRCGVGELCCEYLHRLHPAGHPLGFIDDLVDLAFGDQINRPTRLEIAVAGVQPDIDEI